MDYVARFTELALFAHDYVATDLAKIREWTEVVHSGQDCRTSPTGYGFHDWDSPDHREREIKDARSTRDASVSSKRKDS